MIGTTCLEPKILASGLGLAGLLRVADPRSGATLPQERKSPGTVSGWQRRRLPRFSDGVCEGYGKKCLLEINGL
jgi:hypothetical protein